MIAAKMGFDSVYPVSGQTYSRKIDFNVAFGVSGIAQRDKVCHRCAPYGPHEGDG
jgi:hypothetical protein